MSTTATHSDPRDGVFGVDAQGRNTITFTRQLSHSPERVWRALTDMSEVQAWMRGRWDFEPRIGGTMSMLLSGDDQPDDDAANLGTVTAYDPPHVLEFTFTVTGPTSHGEQHVLRWELASTSDGCILMLCNAFAPGERARNSIVCGWHHGVDNLETYLAGGTIVWDDARARLEALYWHYRSLPRD